MARKPRIHYPGALYHVILRGNARQDVFFDDKDRYRFYLFMQEGIERFGHRVLAFCLMTNHIHLAVQVGEVTLSRIMQNLTFRYTRWINWRLKRSGHLFQGRYKSVLVDADSYLLELGAYIHLNPVRASMVATPEAYPWSSHRAYLGNELIPWLNTDYILSQFSPNLSKARHQFVEYVAERSKDGHQEEFYGIGSMDSRVMGEDQFVEKILEKTESLPIRKPGIEEVLQVVKKMFDLQEDEIAAPGQKRLQSEARSMAAWAVQELTDEPLARLADRLGRDPSSLSAAIRRFELRRRSNLECEEKAARLKQELQVAVFQA
jgi:REP element-mobilizing transposase RayT